MARLPASSIEALADLVAAGYRLVESLDALPRQSLSPKTLQRLETEIRGLRAGAPLAPALERLGLEITAIALLGSPSQSTEDALRADAEARRSATDALRGVRSKIQLFAAVLAALTLVVLLVSLVFVPRAVRQLTENLPADMELPPVLVHFEAFRNLWLTLGGSMILLLLATTMIYAGLLGRQRAIELAHQLRLNCPFLRSHAIQASSARLLEALAHEQAVNIPANETVRRVARSEKVPRLKHDLELAAARLEAGEPWQACLRGTLHDTPLLADLTALASHGARPKGWRWGAARSRATALQDLRRAMAMSAALVLIPSFLYMFLLLKAATVTLSVAQVEGVRQQLEMLTNEVERLIPAGD
ncbi:MAG: hypothetical protein AAF657_21985 [Acidobacteriota bacterium]